MKTAVRYFSRSGNTKKLAEAIGEATGAEARDLNADLLKKVDILFLGTSLYKGTYDPSVADFLRRNADKIGKAVCFGSSASGKTTLKKVKEAAAEKGIPVADRMFSCYGHFLFLHKDRPNKEDLKAAAVFAKEILEG